jgi:SPP1 family predicted phage head-tail adaptor
MAAQKVSFDKRIIIQRPAVVVSPDSGDETIVYNDLITVWAAEEDLLQGSEKETEGQILATQKINFIIRWRLGMDKTDRIFYDNDTYDIELIQKIGRRKYLKLGCVIRE